MKNLKIGFVGTGNMGSALIKGIIDVNLIASENILAYDTNRSKLEKFSETYNLTIKNNLKDTVESSDVIILAVKPNNIKDILESIKMSLTKEKIFISVVVGASISFYEKTLGNDKKIVITMPNTPALVREGMTLYSCNKNMADKDVELIQKIFDSIGLSDQIEESLMNQVTSLTASSPAYVFMLIEAMSDAAVLSGLSRDLSYKWAAQAILGSAKMVLETGMHPAQLKDQVCSPAGTTIEAVKELEKNNFRSTVIEAMNVCTLKSNQISNKINSSLSPTRERGRSD